MRASGNIIQPYFICCCLLATILSACGLRLSPVPAGPAVLGPQSVIQRQNPITTAATANFLSQAQIRQNSQQRFEMLVEQQRWMGRKVMMQGDADPRYQRLARIFEAVSAVSHVEGAGIFPVLIDAPQFQAHTYGGREVVFYTGLSERLEEDALAFVVAHELAHIAAGHVGEASSLGVININRSSGLPRENDLYSYGHEREADKIAIVYLLLAGFAPGPALSLWQEMAASSSDRIYDLFTATHPATADRAEALAENARLFLRESAQFDADNLLNCNPLYCNLATGN